MRKQLYVGTQNDIIYIIDQPPRPSHDDKADVPDISIIAKMLESTPAARRVAEEMVAAYNDRPTPAIRRGVCCP